MSINIKFEDGSSPYVRNNMSDDEFTEELEKWQKNYILILNSMFGTRYCYTAKEKNNA